MRKLENVAKMLPSDRKTPSCQLRAVDNVASKVEHYAAKCSPPLDAERLKAVKKRFTLENIQKIREALTPPNDYDLEGELWDALHSYHSSFEPCSFDELSPKQQTEKIAEVEHKAGLLLSLLREQTVIISDIINSADPVHTFLDMLHVHESQFDDIKKFLEKLIKGCQELELQLPKIKGGRHAEVGQREFFDAIYDIHFEVTGRRATRKFYRLCYEALIGAISEENVARIATFTNRNLQNSESFVDPQFKTKLD